MRQIITAKDLAASPSSARGPLAAAAAAEAVIPGVPDAYADKVMKLIPAEVVSLYVTLDAIIHGQQVSANLGTILMWTVFAAGLLGTPFHLVKIARVTKRSQIVTSTIAYVVWVLALGGPFESVGLPRFVGAILLVIMTFALPAFTEK